jgi:DNA-binding transcriptional regulator LsrR (DeoR family)
MDKLFSYSDQNRLVAKILTLYYMENINQAEIARMLGLSPAKVNRMMKAARQTGMVEINIRLPFQNLIELETRICKITNLDDVVVTPSMDENGGDLTAFAQMAASYLVSKLKPKDSICIGGGRTLSEIINYLDSENSLGVRIYSAIGGIQRNLDLDVNGLATRMARRLGGEAFQFYAPTFAESTQERDTFFKLSNVIRALEQAREARVALFGIGALEINASIIQYSSLPYHKLSELVSRRNGVGEILGYVIDAEGNDCIPELSNQIVGINLDEAHRIPVRIGAAAGAAKAPAIAAAIKGNHFTSLVIDESAARQVLAIISS